MHSINTNLQICGTIEKITFYNEHNGFCVFKLQPNNPKKDNLITVIGSTTDLRTGEYATCIGSWVKDPIRGLQFKASQINLSNPTTKLAIEKYLSSGLIKGVGPGFAKRLVATFGNSVLELIETDPEKLLSMPGIGRKRYQQIIENWAKHKAVRNIIIFLQEHGIGSARAIKIYKIYKEQAIDKIKENPYRLALEIYGIGFKIADQLAISLGIPKNSIIRAEAGIRFILQQWVGYGHCAMRLGELIKNVHEQLEISEELIKAAIDKELVANRIMVEAGSTNVPVDQQDGRAILQQPDGQDSSVVFLTALYVAEKYIATKVFQLSSGKPEWYNSFDLEQEISLMERYAKIKFSRSQVLAIHTALQSKFIIITGGPGVGKTTVARSILHLIASKTNKILLCAPTGKAAKRLSETTNMPASTLHRMLAFDPTMNKFKYNEDHPLDVKFMLIDEGSMVDLLMFANLLKAIPLDCVVVLMGDVDQLPSVGAGAVLADLINSDCVKVVALQEIFRQSASSKIILNAHRVNQGKLPYLEHPLTKQEHSDFYFIKIDNLENLHNKILSLMERIKIKFGFDLIKEVQLLTPMGKGISGTIALNNLLQCNLNENFNKPNLKINKFGIDFVIGDKVIQNINNYDKEIFNGDVGFIESIDPVNNNVLINFDGRSINYDFDELDEINLAYALTIHKSQGSEYPVVIIPLCLQHYTLLQKNLIYTGITRGKSLVVLIGQIKALVLAVKNLGNTRLTRLQTRLQAVFEKSLLD